MSIKQVIGLIGSVLAVMAGVATSAHYTQWAQLKELTYWTGVIEILFGSGGLFAVGLSLPNRTQRNAQGGQQP